MSTIFSLAQQKYLDEKFQSVDDRFTKVVAKLTEHDERFERLEAKIDNIPTREEFYTYMDEAMGRLKNYEDDHVILHRRVGRCEEKLGIA